MNEGESTIWKRLLGRPNVGIVVAALVTLAVVSSTTIYLHDQQSTRSTEPPTIPLEARVEPSVRVPEPSAEDRPDTVEAPVLKSVNVPFDPTRIRIPLIGHSNDGVTMVDLTTPDATVHSVLTLIDEGKTDQLDQCFAEDVNGLPDDPYPRYLGHPIQLLDVIEENESAKVIWEATTHTAFTRKDQAYSPGESVTLTAQLVRVDGFWKLVKFNEY
jgi:hypothetical protein